MKECEPDDPMELVGVALPGSTEAMRDMAYVFAEEFARMGMDAEAILQLFASPFYGGAHQAYRALGADEVRAIVRECVGVWGPAARVIREAPAPAGDSITWLPDPRLPQATPMPGKGARQVPAGLGRN